MNKFESARNISEPEPKWRTVNYMRTIESGGQKSAAVECNGKVHRKILHNMEGDKDEYVDSGEVWPCDEAEHSPAFDDTNLDQ